MQERGLLQSLFSVQGFVATLDGGVSDPHPAATNEATAAHDKIAFNERLMNCFIHVS
jgi:hypothetical protein